MRQEAENSGEIRSANVGVDESVDAAVNEIYRPILRGYFAVFALYYLVMIVLNAMSMPEGSGFIMLQSATAIAAGVALGGSVYLRKPRPGLAVATMLSCLNVMVVANVYIALNIAFLPEKLIYFIIATVLFALAGTSFRQSLLSIGFGFVAMASFVDRLDSANLSSYGFLTFGAAVSSLSIAYYLRKAITRIAVANQEAREKLSQANEMSERLREQSLSDSLTGLPNRRAFFGALKHVVELGSNKQPTDAGAITRSWLILVDLDGFKAVNDIHGHLTGDLLLKAVSKRLSEFSRDDAHISRMGGDEFNIVVSGPYAQDDIVARCEALLEAIAKPYFIEGRQVVISCSAGCYEVQPNQAFRTQMSNADYALLVAKKQGKNRVVVFDETHAEQAGTRFRIENALRNSDLASEISVVFQPQFKLGSNAVVGAEVLARWTNSEVGSISPQSFIKIAEESGLVANITLVVIEKALAQISSWEEPIPLSINLSGHDLMSDPVMDQIVELVTRYNVDPALIEFEVTETAMMADLQKASDKLSRLAELGFSIALDDFGTGYSNFNYLRSLPIRRLKVDRSFIENPGDPMAEKVLASLVGMARVLGVNCLLEGVEDEIALLMAKRAGAELVQGYLFGKPMEADELLELVGNARASHPLSQAS